MATKHTITRPPTSATMALDAAAEAIFRLLDQEGFELLLSLNTAAQLLDDVDNYKGLPHAVELAGLASWSLHPARAFAEKLDAAFDAWANASDPVAVQS
jgi:hypothetical protein